MTTEIELPIVDSEDTLRLDIVSAVTLADILGPLDVVDLLEVDIQGAELAVLPPAMDLLDRKVRWLHLGTHGAGAHAAMVTLLRSRG
ncbi:MAG: FkbM family methyltransferase [Alphaproteobacteria bacterium]|nr:FkbM family methyltransferase [Alphaproteobacteria bacterium]